MQPGRRRALAALSGLGALAAAPRWSAAGPETTAHDLHGLAQLQLPPHVRLRGLVTRHRDLPPAAQLERHDERRPLVFEFDADARNSWGGHALDPLLLNVVLFDPGNPGAHPERGFSIGRYGSPTGGTIPLTDPRWQQREDGAGDSRRVWRWLAMDDHFGNPGEPRWALSVHEPARAVRLDLFVWRRKLTREAAEALLAAALSSLRIQPARDALFQRAGHAEARLAALRDRHVAACFKALAPLGVPVPAKGAVTLGRDTAAWLDDDGRALRALRLLARVPLPAAATGQPRLATTLPGSLPRRPPEVLYWHAASATWRKTGLTRSLGPDDWPLLPIEAALAARLPEREGAYLVLPFHAYQPPVLDDANGVHDYLADTEAWRTALLAGQVPGLVAAAAQLRGEAR